MTFGKDKTMGNSKRSVVFRDWRKEEEMNNHSTDFRAIKLAHETWPVSYTYI